MKSQKGSKRCRATRKFCRNIGHLQILKGGNAFLSVRLIEEAVSSYPDLDLFY